MIHLPVIDPLQREFPPLDSALDDPNGLLAMGGDLQPETLLTAYRQGIFPWFEEGQPILWWSPNPRAVIYPREFKISRSLGKNLRSDKYQVTLDQAFPDVIGRCAAPRNNQAGTWITDDMTQAYIELNRLGHAHSVEVWENQSLVGGLYGVSIGRVFFGESMFSISPDASKIAMAHLCSQKSSTPYQLIDCQLPSDHLSRLGAKLISRYEFTQLLNRWCPIHQHSQLCRHEG